MLGRCRLEAMMSDQNSEPRQAAPPAPAETIPSRPTPADMIEDLSKNDLLRAIRIRVVPR